MRRLMLTCILLSAFMANGWERTLAAAQCVHAAGDAHVEHACCRAHSAQHIQHHAAQPTIEADAETASQPAPLCSHCLSRTAPTPAAARACAQQTKRDNTAQPACTQIASAFNHPFTPVVAPTSHAPPNLLRKHLLLNVFLL